MRSRFCTERESEHLVVCNRCASERPVDADALCATKQSDTPLASKYDNTPVLVDVDRVRGKCRCHDDVLRLARTWPSLADAPCKPVVDALPPACPCLPPDTRDDVLRGHVRVVRSLTPSRRRCKWTKFLMTRSWLGWLCFVFLQTRFPDPSSRTTIVALHPLLLHEKGLAQRPLGRTGRSQRPRGFPNLPVTNMTSVMLLSCVCASIACSILSQIEVYLVCRLLKTPTFSHSSKSNFENDKDEPF